MLGNYIVVDVKIDVLELKLLCSVNKLYWQLSDCVRVTTSYSNARWREISTRRCVMGKKPMGSASQSVSIGRVKNEERRGNMCVIYVENPLEKTKRN